MSKLTTAAALCALSGAILWTACSSATVKAAVKAEKDRKTAPDFALKDSNGQTVHLSDYKGKVVLLDFWATWCGPCKIEIPWFMEFEQQYKDRGFAVLGVSMDEDGWSVVKPYIQNMKINYRVVLGDEEEREHVSDLYGGLDSLPTTLLLDRQSKIASVHVGLGDGGKEVFKNDIAQLLGTPRPGIKLGSAGVFVLLASPK